MKHVMIDIETLGTGTNAAICSIGALAFDPVAGKVMDLRDTRVFHKLISLEKSHSPGVIDPATVIWWLKQSREAITALFDQPEDQYDSLEGVLIGLDRWLKMMGAENVWSNGPMFDERIIREACDRVKHHPPFSYRASRCFRTIAQLVADKGFDLKELHATFKRERQNNMQDGGLLKHRAIDDCASQAWAVCRFYQILGLAPTQAISGAGRVLPD